MAFLKVKSPKEWKTEEKPNTIIDGKIKSIQQAHVRLQEGMMIEYDPIIPTNKLETIGTEKSPLNLGEMTKAQATRRTAEPKSPISAKSGGVLTPTEPRVAGDDGELCRLFHPYTSKEKQHNTSLHSSSIPSPSYPFPIESCLVSSSDFSYLVKWCQNHTVARDLKTIRGTQSNKLSYDSRSDYKIAPNRIFEATVLLSLFNGDTSRYSECLALCKFFYSVHLWDFGTLVGYPHASTTNIGSLRFSNNITSYMKLSKFCQGLFIEVPFYKKDSFSNKVKVDNSYWFKDGFDLKEILTGGIASSSLCFNIHNIQEVLVVTVLEFSKMSLHGQIIIMKNAASVKDDLIEVALYSKNEVGRYGRQYSSMTELSRFDRAEIVSLKGYDMEAAMQTILLHLFPQVTAPFFTRYVAKKKQVRQEIATLMGWSIEQTKEIIQAIVMDQGKKSYSKKLEETFGIYTERDAFIEEIMKKVQDTTDVARYARKRTKDKYERTASISFKKLTPAQKRTFMFFYWTFYERKIQNVMSEMLTDPLPLHDAVYSQSKLPLMHDVEQKIKAKTGIDMKLGMA